MSTYKSKSTLSAEGGDICTRISSRPLISPKDVVPSDPRLNVIGVLNPTFINIEGKRKLIIRVDERPIQPSSSHHGSISTIGNIKLAYIDVESAGQLEIIDIGDVNPNHAFEKPILSESIRNLVSRNNHKELLLSYISHLRIVNMDGDVINVDKIPAIFPSKILDQYGCEDPRATNIQDQHFVVYTGMSRFGATTWMAKLSEEFRLIEDTMILGPDHKHSTIFPERMNGFYYLLTRPLSRTYLQSNGIWLFRSPDALHWGNPLPVLFPRINKWDSKRVGPAASPQLTDQGWLLLYYGVDEEESYRIGTALLETDNPSIVIARTEYPILTPTLEWERNGRRADIVFACGLELVDNQSKLRIYYGGADTFIGLAEVSMSDLLIALTTDS